MAAPLPSQHARIENTRPARACYVFDITDGTFELWPTTCTPTRSTPPSHDYSATPVGARDKPKVDGFARTRPRGSIGAVVARRRRPRLPELAPLIPTRTDRL